MSSFFRVPLYPMGCERSHQLQLRLAALFYIIMSTVPVEYVENGKCVDWVEEKLCSIKKPILTELIYEKYNQ